MRELIIGNTHIGMGGHPSDEEVNTMVGLLEKYGMVDKVSLGLEKQTPKKPQFTPPSGDALLDIIQMNYTCPTCGASIMQTPYCHNCGQKLLWEDSTRQN